MTDLIDWVGGEWWEWGVEGGRGVTLMGSSHVEMSWVKDDAAPPSPRDLRTETESSAVRSFSSYALGRTHDTTHTTHVQR
jgi:hypothetical protein